MPAYEMMCLVKAFERPDLIKVIKKGAEMIINKGGIIRKFENLGFNKLPYRMKHNTEIFSEANFILIKFDLPTKEANFIENEFRKNSDFIRSSISMLHEHDENFKSKCECLETGKYLKHSIDYSKPITTNNRRVIFRDYSVRL